MKLKIKLLEGGRLPVRSTEGSEMDVFARKIDVFEHVATVYLGFKTEIPPGYRGILLPRSSVSNQNWMLANSIGLIDSDYRGEWIMKFRQVGHDDFLYQEGDKVGQIYFEKKILIDTEIVDELSKTKRGEGGFGSTDNIIKGPHEMNDIMSAINNHPKEFNMGFTKEELDELIEHNFPDINKQKFIDSLGTRDTVIIDNKLRYYSGDVYHAILQSVNNSQ